MAVRDYLHLFGRFLREPRAVGAVAPSSPLLADAMVRGLIFGPGTRVVELGPGTGAFTGALRARLQSGGRLLVVEREGEFVRLLGEKWPDLDCACASAEELPALVDARGLQPVDHIVSGLPFASLPQAVTRRILDGIDAVLRPGGTFSTFQYVHAFHLPPAVAFRRDVSRRLHGDPARELVVPNVPPAWVLRWTRPVNGAG